MKFVVDTSVWSAALRRRRTVQPEPVGARLLRSLVEDNVPLVLPGIVMQELLSGVRGTRQFERLQAALSPFTTIYASQAHHVLAAQLCNTCRSSGVATTPTDVLIAATAILEDAVLLTSDQDFVRIAEYSDLQVELVG